MTPAQFKALKTGDLVRGRFSGFAYVVTENRGDRVTAVRTQDLANPADWDLVDRDGRVIDHAAEQPGQGEAVFVVFDGPPGPESGRFVEVETAEGRSLRVGEWEQKGNYWTLGPLYAAPPAPAVPDDVAKDAARYRWMVDHCADVSRTAQGRWICQWFDSQDPGAALDCTGFYDTADQAVDAAMLAAATEVPHG